MREEGTYVRLSGWLLASGTVLFLLMQRQPFSADSLLKITVSLGLAP